MSLIRAVVIKEKGVVEIRNVPSPTIRPGYILVKAEAYAINPTDWKHIDFLPTIGARVGCDYAGTVIAVGNAVTNDLKPGDRVAGFSHGANAVNLESGAFADVLMAKGDIQFKIPPNLSFEEASTLGVGITTIGQGLYQSLKLPFPNDPNKRRFPILIFGGSTASGALAIQAAKLSGCEVITTCSPHNVDYMKSLGADKVFDHHSRTCTKDIKEYTFNQLRHVLDCISDNTSLPICVKALSDEGGEYSTLQQIEEEKVKAINGNVEVTYTLGYTAVGEYFKIRGKAFPAKREDFEFGKKWRVMASDLLAEGKLKPHKLAINEGGKGLEGVIHGIDLVRDGKVSGKKLVYTVN